MAVEVFNLDPVWIKPAPQGARPVVIDGPLIPASEKFLVIGTRLEPETRRVTLICEQIIFDPSVVVALIHYEPWEVGAAVPNTLVVIEPWDVILEDPTNTFHYEPWDVSLGTPTDEFMREPWELF